MRERLVPGALAATAFIGTYAVTTASEQPLPQAEVKTCTEALDQHAKLTPTIPQPCERFTPDVKRIKNPYPDIEGEPKMVYFLPSQQQFVKLEKEKTPHQSFSPLHLLGAMGAAVLTFEAARWVEKKNRQKK